MANELPYFRFTVQAWQNGRIGIESFELKGLFIDICGYYWINDCHVTLTMLKKRFSNAKGIFELIELGIIKHENKHDKVEIDFLNFQYDLLSEKRKLRQAAGSKGGNAKAMLKQKGSYKDKDNNKDKDKDKDSVLLEFYFNDLPNSTYLEQISRSLNLPKETLLLRVKDFRKFANVKYRDFPDFCNHFKNWLIKQTQTQPQIIKKRQPL